jgi:low temperature requirement protein LtrA
MRIAVSREPGAEREVSPLELFFDLVYVFAIGQLSHHLVALLAFGGPGLFLLAQLLFHHAAPGRAPRSRALGLGALAILAVAAAPLTLIVGIAASSAVLVAVAIADTVEAGAVVTA